MSKNGSVALPANQIGTGVVLLALCACSGPQSSLDPAAPDASRVATLFWWMTVGSLVVWLVVVALAVYSTYVAPERHGEKQTRRLIVWGGVVFPTVVLLVLLIFGLKMLPELLAPAPPGSLRIRVSGEQWWWRVVYLPANGPPVTSANEIRLPVNQPVEFELESPDVIHSFWIPSLGGKMDMIPGRKTRLRLLPTRLGTFRGVCAEYCGTSHALMAFPVVVQTEQEFQSWLAGQALPARAPDAPEAQRGQAAFHEHGCGACHSVRGTDANGVIGPDLTHVGSRLSLGAGTTGATLADFERWIAETDKVKPGVHMPAFGMLSRADRTQLSVYLKSLQ